MQTTRGASLRRRDNGEPPTEPNGQRSAPRQHSDRQIQARQPRRIAVLVGVAAIVVALDQVAKALALRELSDGRVVEVLGDVLQLRLVRNSGAAFGMFTNGTVVLTLIAFVVVIVILRMSRRLSSLPWAIALGGFLGGALGNLSDRIFRAPKPLSGHVIDFLELPNWPVFNLADCAIVGAAILVAILSLRGVPFEAGQSKVTDVPGSEGDVPDEPAAPDQDIK